MRLSQKACQNSLKTGHSVFEYDLDIWSLYGTRQIDCACRVVSKCDEGPAYFDGESSCLLAMKKQFACADTTATALAFTSSQRPRSAKSKTASSRRTPNWKSLVNGLTSALSAEDSDNEWAHLVSNIQYDIQDYKHSEQTASKTERVAKLVDSIFNSVTNAREDASDVPSRHPVLASTSRITASPAPVVDVGNALRVHEFTEVPHLAIPQPTEAEEVEEEVDDIFDSMLDPLTESISSYYHNRMNDARYGPAFTDPDSTKMDESSELPTARRRGERVVRRETQVADDFVE